MIFNWIKKYFHKRKQNKLKTKLKEDLIKLNNNSSTSKGMSKIESYISSNDALPPSDIDIEYLRMQNEAVHKIERHLEKLSGEKNKKENKDEITKSETSKKEEILSSISSKEGTKMMSSSLFQTKMAELKCKRKTLASEAKIIRYEELRWAEKASKASMKQKLNFKEIAEGTRESLWDHRTKKVRIEARYSHIANAFLSGKPYQAVENKSWRKNWITFTSYYHWCKIAELVYRFSDGKKTKKEITNEVFIWRNQHPAYQFLLQNGKSSWFEEQINQWGDVWIEMLNENTTKNILVQEMGKVSSDS